MQKPIYSPSEEQALMTQLWTDDLANDPEAFVMFIYPWGVENTPLARFKGPRTWQRKVLRSIAFHIKMNKGRMDMSVLRKAVSSGRGIGKSALVSWLIQWMMTTRIGATVIVSANSENQLRSVTWGELTKWVTMSIHCHWWEISATKLIPAQWLTDLVERDLKKGTRYWAAEGKLWSEENPDSYAGVHNHDGMMVIFDEASGIPDSIWSVASGFFTENILDRYWLAFSNPRRPEGYFFDCFHTKAEFWETSQIDSRTVEDTDKQVYAQIISEYGDDSNEAKVEVYGQFPDIGDGHLISSRAVDGAIEREAYMDPTAPLVMGVDPAGEGKDDTAITLRRGLTVLPVIRFREPDPMALVGRIISYIREYKPKLIVVDQVGLGWGIVGRLQEQGFAVRGFKGSRESSNKLRWKNQRIQVWDLMKTWLEDGSIPNDKKLRTELMTQKFKYTSNGAKSLVSKRDSGEKSPDSADALALTFAYPMFQDDELVRSIPVVSQYKSYSSAPTSWMSA